MRGLALDMVALASGQGHAEHADLGPGSGRSDQIAMGKGGDPVNLLTEEAVRALKAEGKSDPQIANELGTTTNEVRNLRRRHKISGLAPSFRPVVAKFGVDAAGWPEVLDPETRDRRWRKYFARIGHNHSRDDLTFRRTSRVLAQPDRSHHHGLGATSLEFL